MTVTPGVGDGVCEACGDPIRWRVSEKTGNANPINVDTDPEGNIWLNPDGRTYHVLTKAEKAEAAGLHLFDDPQRDRYKSHFATCKNAAAFRRRGRDPKGHRTPGKNRSS